MTRFRFIVLFAFCLAVGWVVPVSARAATLQLAPAAETHPVGEEFSVRIIVDTVGQAINASEASLTFSTKTLEVASLSSDGIFTLWTVDPTFSNTAGTITLSGGLTSPGYTGASGTILTITFRGKTTGTGTVSFSGARVLANDGQGTDLLTSRKGGSYAITPGQIPVAPTIRSITHPDQNAWYAVTTPAFTWTQETGVLGFSYGLDQVNDTLPNTVEDGTLPEKSYTDVGDGSWYFHVRARTKSGWGEAAHYRVQIDTTAPLPFAISFPDGQETNITRPRVSFETTDITSGVSYYTVSIDSSHPTWVAAGATAPYQLGNLTAGQYLITATAYDFAGNASETTATLMVRVLPSVVVPDQAEQELARVITILERTLPKPILTITDQFARVVQRLRRGAGTSDIITNIVQPAVTTTTVVATATIATTVTTFQIANLFYFLLRFGYLWLVPIIFGKRRKPWGIIFDSTTGRPIKRAVVRIFSKEYNKLKESQITDSEGRFGFLVDIGQYVVTVTSMGFLFPSRLLVSAAVSQFDNIYRGQVLDVRQRTEQALHINVPLDPDSIVLSARRIFWLKLLNFMGISLEKLNVPLLAAGTLASWISLIIIPTLNNYLFLLLYGLLIILKYIIAHHYERSWGEIRDAKTGQPIGLAVVRIYDMSSGLVVGTRVTNRQGQFTALVAPGQYYIIVIKSGYESYQSQPVSVSREAGLIRMNVRLVPLGPGVSSTFGGHRFTPMSGIAAAPTPPVPAQPPAPASPNRGEPST